MRTNIDFDISALFVGSLFFQVIQVGVYPILLSQIMSSDNYGSSIIGILVSISWISVFVAGPFVPAFIRRAGYRISTVLAFLLTACSLCLLLWSQHLAVLIVSSSLMGAGLILRWISCDTLLVEKSTFDSRGKIIGWHEALMGLGIGLGPLFFFYFDLRTVAWICVALAVAGQMAFQIADMNAETAETTDTETRPRTSVYRLIAIALAAAFVAGFIESSSIALFPLHFENFGYTLASSAVLVSAFGFGGTLLQPPLGYLSDKKGYAFSQILCLSIVTAGCIIVALVPENVVIMFCALFFIGGAAGGLNTLAVIEAAQTLEGPHVPVAMTAIAMLYTLGGVGGPIAAGATLEMANNLGMIVLFGGVAAMLCTYLLANHRVR